MASPDFTNAQLALQNACVQVEDERMKYLLAQRAAHERGLRFALKDSRIGHQEDAYHAVSLAVQRIEQADSAFAVYRGH